MYYVRMISASGSRGQRIGPFASAKLAMSWGESIARCCTAWNELTEESPRFSVEDAARQEVFNTSARTYLASPLDVMFSSPD